MAAVDGLDPGVFSVLLTTISDTPLTDRTSHGRRKPCVDVMSVSSIVEDNNDRLSEGSNWRGTESGESSEEEEEDKEKDTDTDVSGYETDLDIKKDDELRKKPKERDDIQAYKEACEDMGVVLQRSILDQMSNSEMILRFRNIGPMGAKALSRAFMQNIHVEYLDLKYNGLSAEGALYICEMLLENDTLLKLDLSGNQLKTKGALALSEMMRLNTGLRHLIVASNDFVDSDSEILAAGIQANDIIREFNISNNGLSIRGGRAFGLALAKNYAIRSLDLSWNHIREKGAVALCKGLQENIALTHIDLSHNGFGYEGSVAIEKLLKANKVIKYLDISFNRITWDAVTVICRGIKSNDTLETLKMGGNPLTTTGCIDIIESIADSNSAISELDLQGVCVLGEFDMMASAIQRVRKFTYRHGGVVGTHDVLGERRGKRITPMQRVINYMKKTGIRPTELFRSMDKQVSNRLSHQEMITRLKRSGIEMHLYEAVELIDQLERHASDMGESECVNYKNVSRCVKDQIIKDRNDKIRERERLKRLYNYHKDILKKGNLPPISDAQSETKTLTLPSDYESRSVRSMGRLSLDTLPFADTEISGVSAPDFSRLRRSELIRLQEGEKNEEKAESQLLKGNLKRAIFKRAVSSSAISIPSDLVYRGRVTESTATASTASGAIRKAVPPKKRSHILSMSQPLGSKPRPFGAAKKKKRKARKAKRR